MIKIDCSENVYDCKDFRTESEAQSVYLECGGLNNDVHHLDEDGRACESLL